MLHYDSVVKHVKVARVEGGREGHILHRNCN